MTGYGEIQTAVSAIKLGAYDFLEKPINPSILAQKIETAFKDKPTEEPHQKKHTKEYKKEEKRNTTVEGRSPLSTRMYSFINTVAPTQMAVMIIGESATATTSVKGFTCSSSPFGSGRWIEKRRKISSSSALE